MILILLVLNVPLIRSCVGSFLFCVLPIFVRSTKLKLKSLPKNRLSLSKESRVTPLFSYDKNWCVLKLIDDHYASINWLLRKTKIFCENESQLKVSVIVIKQGSENCKKRLAEVNLTSSPLGFFKKNVFSRKRVKPCTFVTFYIIISYFFPEKFNKIPLSLRRYENFLLGLMRSPYTR